MKETLDLWLDYFSYTFLSFPDYRYDETLDAFILRVLEHKDELKNLRFERISHNMSQPSLSYLYFDLNDRHYKVVVANKIGYYYGVYGVKELDGEGNIIHETAEDIRVSRYTMLRFNREVTFPIRDAYFDDLFDRRESKKKIPENKTEWLNGLP